MTNFLSRSHLGIFCGIALLLSCSNAPPNEREAIGQVQEYLYSYNGGAIYSISRIEKSNGYRQDDVTYIAQISYALRVVLPRNQAT